MVGVDCQVNSYVKTVLIQCIGQDLFKALGKRTILLKTVRLQVPVLPNNFDHQIE